MTSSPSVAANLPNDARKGLAILSLSKAEPIAHLADREGVSRQFLYRQKQKAAQALDEAFAAKDDGVLFYLPVTEARLNQLTLALILVLRRASSQSCGVTSSGKGSGVSAHRIRRM